MTDQIDNSNFIIAQIKERAANTPRIVSPRSRRFTKEFREIIKDAINADIPLPRIAEILSISVTHLKRVCDEMHGIPRSDRGEHSPRETWKSSFRKIRELIQSSHTNTVLEDFGRYTITCYDDRGLQIARLLVDMPKEGTETLVCLISEHGKKEFFFTYPAVKKFFEDYVS